MRLICIHIHIHTYFDINIHICVHTYLCPARLGCASSINGVPNRMGNYYWKTQDVTDDAMAEAKCASECIRREGSCGYAVLTVTWVRVSVRG